MDQTITGTGRRLLIFIAFALVLLVLVMAGRLAVDIYEQAHPRDVDVWCDPVKFDDGTIEYDESYKGPADLVLGACDRAVR